MFISTHVEVLAFSAAGDAVLIGRRSDGPEGGGSLGWSVIGPAESFYAEVSSDFSPGDGSTPETVSVGDCRARAKDLAARVAGFPGVTVRPEQCGRERHAVVTVAGEARAVEGAGKGLKVELGATAATFVTDGGTLTVALPEHLAASVWRRGDDGPLVAVWTLTDTGSFLPVLVSVAAGAPAQVRFPDKTPLPY